MMQSNGNGLRKITPELYTTVYKRPVPLLVSEAQPVRDEIVLSTKLDDILRRF